MLWRVAVPLDGNAPTFCDADTSYECLMAPHFVIKGGLLWLHRVIPLAPRAPPLRYRPWIL
jgi:hypothetical protein